MSTFREDQAARGRPVCDGFEPCKAAQATTNPWADAPDFTPCGRCGWSRRTHDADMPDAGADTITVPDVRGAHLLPIQCPRCGHDRVIELEIKPPTDLATIEPKPTGTIEHNDAPQGTGERS